MNFGRHVYVVLTTPEWWSELIPGIRVRARDARILTQRLSNELPPSIKARLAPPGGWHGYYEERGTSLHELHHERRHEDVRVLIRQHARAILVAHHALQRAKGD